MREDWIEIELGKIADNCWSKIPEYFPFVELGHHVVIPNHVHGMVNRMTGGTTAG